MAGIEEGSTVRTRRRRPNPVVIAPGGRNPAAPSTVPAGVAGSGGTTPPGDKTAAGDGSGSGSGSGSGGSAYSKANASAANSYNRQAANLEAQARALRHALSIDARKGLLQQLGDITEAARQRNIGIREGFRSRLTSLQGAADDNEKAASAQTGINQQNQIRERNSAVGEAMAQGAGESDLLKTMLMSLRNWNANQNEIERGYFDTLRSIQSGQTDLEVDTKTALMNSASQKNDAKESLWTNYHNQRSELYTQLGNTLGQAADYRASARDLGSGGGKGGGKKKADDGGRPTRLAGYRAEQGGGSGRIASGPKTDRQGAGGGGGAAGAAAFMNAAKEMGKSWDNPGVSAKIMRWDGAPEIEATRGAPPGLAGVRTVELGKKPEGATLRKW
jgi:hypothetical protein